ncbi:uncharacterized protein LOC110881907 [Helianthus annuus]|uniref:uncharacterized protein LOC110881907 n=1 Tax=Helianthus annuus TaxID=4232 RepID=UPI000B8F4F26|nr:uncharacterized protein LOC110881907 [Helianthus annuus]
MPFGLRNAGDTYQRLVNMMFKGQIRHMMEVYIDDMVVKSKRAEDYLRDLEEAFDILDKFNMKLNPSKCHFGIKAGERLIKYLEIVKKLADSFASFSLTQVPREENAEANALANLGSSLKILEDIKATKQAMGGGEVSFLCLKTASSIS